MKKRIITAITGILLAAALVSGCSDNNVGDGIAPSATEGTAEEVTEAAKSTTERTTSAPDKKNSFKGGDFGEPSEINAKNRSQLLYIMDGGDYIYVTIKKDDEGSHRVYVRDDRKGGKKELDLPEKSEIFWTDGKKLYYYAPDEGLCEYSDGKSSLLSKETKSGESAADRGSFFFTEDKIYFAVSDDSSTEIKSMDYSGKLTDDSYKLDNTGADIVGISDIDGKQSLVCSYKKGIDEHICIFDGENSFTDVKCGGSPYIVGDMIYYIDFKNLSRRAVGSDESEEITEERCTDYCFVGDDLIYTDGVSVFAIDKSGSSKELITADKLSGCDFISRVGVTDGRLFVQGGSGSSWICLAEVDINGSIAEEIYSGAER